MGNFKENHMSGIGIRLYDAEIDSDSVWNTRVIYLGSFSVGKK